RVEAERQRQQRQLEVLQVLQRRRQVFDRARAGHRAAQLQLLQRAARRKQRAIETVAHPRRRQLQRVVLGTEHEIPAAQQLEEWIAVVSHPILQLQRAGQRRAELRVFERRAEANRLQ